MAQHFNCTACGKCCHGQIWLTLNDAFVHADRFPLAFVWTPLRQGHKDYDMASRLGTTIRLDKKHELAVIISAAAYIPPSFSCPALRADKLCGIHSIKPLRCRSMPFSPYREEQSQADAFKFPVGFECDTSDSAPIVFQNKKIVFREDFDLERQALLSDVPTIRRYADYTLKYSPMIVNNLAQASLKAKSGQIITSLSSFLTATRSPDARLIAEKQLPVLRQFITQTAEKKDLAEYHHRYVSWEKEMSFLANRST